jgi:chloride channel protein, CIC family
MSAIFGSPIASIFLAIELLLFEFSPRSIIPVVLACVTGAAGHHFLFEYGPVFPMTVSIGTPRNDALAFYSLIGIAIGVLSVLVTKIVYIIEDGFEKLPIHWMWWPALGGLAIGIIGYFAPRTLGVGYNNITDLLSGNLPFKIVWLLCLAKFLSWAIALGSGTSGGTLAPLLTIGGATGALFGSVFIYLFPQSGITLPLAALVGMSCMFAGASRALLTSIIFALETTSQANALLPLLAACTASYFVSFFLMKNTIMTEKIARRGVKTPHSYEPDILEKISIKQVIKDKGLVLLEENTIEESRKLITKDIYRRNHFIVSSNKGEFKGIIDASELLNNHYDAGSQIGKFIHNSPFFIDIDNSLRTAVEMMAKENIDALVVVSIENKKVAGLLSYQDFIDAYKYGLHEHERLHPYISFKKYSIKYNTVSSEYNLK